MLPFLGQITKCQWFAVSDDATVVHFENRIEENKAHSNYTEKDQ